MLASSAHTIASFGACTLIVPTHFSIGQRINYPTSGEFPPRQGRKPYIFQLNEDEFHNLQATGGPAQAGDLQIQDTCPQYNFPWLQTLRHNNV